MLLTGEFRWLEDSAELVGRVAIAAAYLAGEVVTENRAEFQVRHRRSLHAFTRKEPYC